jgi:hypothetical protein
LFSGKKFRFDYVILVKGVARMKSTDKEFAESKLKNFFDGKAGNIELSADILKKIDNLPQKAAQGTPFFMRKAVFSVAACLIIMFAAGLPLLFSGISQNGNFNNAENVPEDSASADIFAFIAACAENSLSGGEYASSNFTEKRDTGSVTIKFSAGYDIRNAGDSVANGDDYNTITEICGNGITAVLAEFTADEYNGFILYIKGNKGSIKLLGEKTENGYIFSSQKEMNGNRPFAGTLIVTADEECNLTIGGNEYSVINRNTEQKSY